MHTRIALHQQLTPLVTLRASTSPRRAAVSIRGRVIQAAGDDERGVKIDISLADVKQGRKIGSGSFGDVFEGVIKKGLGGQPVILKGKKTTGRVTNVGSEKFFSAEAAICRRLKGCSGVPTFLGVAGAEVYLVWKYEGIDTLEDILRTRDPLKELASCLGVRGEKQAVKALTKRMLTSLDALHKKGCVHRDVKPDNLLMTDSKQVKMIDLGGVADLRTGVNYNPEESVLDPVYGPPERYIDSGVLGGLFGGMAFASKKPDLFDSYSAGLVIMQCALPSLRTRAAIQKMRGALDRNGQDLQKWRDGLSERQQADFEILDADGGKGWDLVQKLVTKREKRITVGKAKGHPFAR